MNRSRRNALPGRVMIPLLLAGCVLLAGCAGSGSKNAEGQAAEVAGSQGDLRFNPNVRIGEIIWVNEGGDFVVVQMDARRADFQPAFFLALDSIGSQISGVLVGGGEVQGRSFGARVLEGNVFEGAEVRAPGRQWAEYLFERYNQSARLPTPQGG